MKISEIVSTYDLGPLNKKSKSFWFRIELHRELGRKGRFFARIWRHETYRLQSTFPQANGLPLHEPSDETVIVEEFSFNAERHGKSSFSVFENIIVEMADRFKENRTLKKNLRLLREHFAKNEK